MAGLTACIHSLPCSGQTVVLLIQARRFRCPNAACPRKTFREGLSALADRYQRRTQVATQLLCSVAAIAGGQAGARLATHLQPPISCSTLLRCLVRQATCPEGVPRLVGVAEAPQIPELRRFVQRLRLDWEAVENALLFASSQGQVEGQVNRLKVFKRQGYGRASPALLQARLVGASNLYRKCA
jgi:transposase